MPMYYVGRAEIETTVLGERTFSGDLSFIENAIQQGINWSQEGHHPLAGALYGRHIALARKLVQAGSPINKDHYALAINYLPEFIKELPANPELVAKLEGEKRWHQFIWALVNQDVDQARKLLQPGLPINQEHLVTHGMGSLTPIHYAIRWANVELIQLVTEAGADINSIDKSGKSPLRLLAENQIAPGSMRRAAIRYLKTHQGRFIPELTVKERLLVFLGIPLSL